MRRPVPPHRHDRHGELWWGAWSIVALGIVVAAFAPFRSRMDPGPAALAMLVAPLVAAIGSLRMAIAVSVVGALTFNLVFTQPFGSLLIESSTGVAVFIAYAGVSLVVAVAVDRVRSASRQSEQRAIEAQLVRDLTIELLRQDVWVQPPVDLALERLVEALGLRGAIARVDIEGGEQFEATHGDVDRTAHEAMVVPLTSQEFEFGELTIEMQPGVRAHESTARVVGVFANLIALACERSRYMQESVRRQALEEAERQRVALVQSVSHDLRTPLTSMRALASTLPEIGDLTPEQISVLEDIDREAMRLARMVDQVLDLSRIDSGMLRPRLERVELDDLVRSAVAAAKPLLADGDAIRITLDPFAPAVPVDEPLMRQVLVNLLENAVRHGAPPFEISVRTLPERVELRVVDHGQGVPERYRRRMFDARWAMEHRSADRRSRGLGLVIGAGFVRAHGGQIRVEPTDGGGATFVVSLPRQAESVEG